MPNKVEIIIPRRQDGRPARGVYSNEVKQILSALGPTKTRRASHVEPWADLSEAAKERWTTDTFKCVPNPVVSSAADNLWFADMLPVGGPVLGPFDGRDLALAAEAEWLRQLDIPIIPDCA